VKRISEILGIPNLDTRFLPAHVVVAIKEGVAKIPGVGALILYGSIVRGEGSPKSDIDVMLVPASNEEGDATTKSVTRYLRGIEREYRLEASFSLTTYTGKEDSYFLWEVMKDGVVLYCGPETAIRSSGNAGPHALIAYRYEGAKEGDKKRVQRFIFESKRGPLVDRNNKTEHPAPGVILLPVDRAKPVIELLDSLHITYSLIKVWR